MLLEMMILLVSLYAFRRVFFPRRPASLRPSMPRQHTPLRPVARARALPAVAYHAGFWAGWLARTREEVLTSWRHGWQRTRYTGSTPSLVLSSREHSVTPANEHSPVVVTLEKSEVEAEKLEVVPEVMILASASEERRRAVAAAIQELTVKHSVSLLTCLQLLDKRRDPAIADLVIEVMRSGVKMGTLATLLGGNTQQTLRWINALVREPVAAGV